MGVAEEAETFCVDEALTAQRALRRALGLGPERFEVPALVGMLSDEIEQMRARGHDDAAIAAVIHAATGKTMDPADIARFYVAEGQRHG